MRQYTQDIHSVQSGAWEMEAEQSAYYYLCKLGIWVEFRVQDSHSPGKQLGARWTIDNWASYYDSPAFLKEQSPPEDEIWRIEIEAVITTGWRDGSIGGPNGEQPSLNRWILWGKDKHSVKCLPLGSVQPLFEFALYLKYQGTVYWENNQGRNFSLCLNNFC